MMPKFVLESKVEKERRLKQQKPYLSCTWYPHECNAAGCDLGQGPCRDYLTDDELDDRWRGW